MFNKIKQALTKSKVTVSTVIAATAMSTVGFCAEGANTGNADLDVLVGNMESGLGSIKTGGLYIISAIIVIAVVFLGGRWLWNLFRSWLSRAA